MIIDLEAACLVLVALSAQAPPSNWSGWRGPHADGHSTEKDLPQRWSDESIAWKTALPGRGQSSPVLWGDRIFLTSALEKGKQRVLFCVDRKTGKLEWEKVVWTGDPEPSHAMNGWASATCVVDAERVYAFFGKGGGLQCYTHAGAPVWALELGVFEGPWGTAACPILVGDLLIQNCDADKDARLIAVDKKTGKEVWSTPRLATRGWSTPVLIEAGARKELVLNGQTGVIAYAPETGKELWTCRCDQGRGEPTVTPADGLLYVANGLSGGGLYSIRPGGSGDVTASHRLWLSPRKGRDTPSPLVIGNTILLMSLNPDVLTGYEAKDGKELWKLRTGSPASSSPVGYDGLGFLVLENGETIVIDPKSEDHIVARNKIGIEKGELFRASITPSEGQIFLRSDRSLYCIGKRKSG